jgi:hypothetical protein
MGKFADWVSFYVDNADWITVEVQKLKNDGWETVEFKCKTCGHLCYSIEETNKHKCPYNSEW